MEKFYTPFLSNPLPSSIIIILLLSSHACLQAKAQALCLSQFALANEACSFNRPAGPGHVEPQANPWALMHEGHRHRRDHDHGHDHDHDHRTDPHDSACCRRLTSIDNACVCEVLARLPLFITWPKHDLWLSPAKGCNVSFECDGRG